MTRSRSFVFTCFNMDFEDVIKSLDYQYLVFGRELCPTTLRMHLQGYLYFKSARTFVSLQKKLPGVHLEIAKGPPSANLKYCTKEGDYEEFGTPPKDPKDQGIKEKERWALARQNAERGLLEDVPDDIYIRYYRTLKEIKKDHMVKPDDADNVTGIWIWGPAGAGKSRYARDRYPDSYFKLANKWWDGYQEEISVIIDDLDPNHKVLGHHLKIWGDRYAFLAETKGGAMMIRPQKIVITSQYPPEQIWDDAQTLAAIRRRYEVIHMTDFFSTQGVRASITPDPLCHVSNENSDMAISNE